MNFAPTAILCDLDDCLYGYEVAHNAGITAAIHHLATRLSTDVPFLERSFREARNQVHSLLGDTASSHSKLLQFKALLDQIGLGGRADMSLELESVYWGNFLRKMEASDGAVRFLEACRESGVEVFLVTDLTLQIQLRKVITLDLVGYFAAILTSEEVGADKPSPKFLDLLSERFGAELSSSWVVGDNEQTDGRLAEHIDARFWKVPKPTGRRKFFETLTRELTRNGAP